MTTDPAFSPTDHLKNALEEMRASMVAEGKRRGLKGAIQEAILSLLETLLAILADFRAGRLAAVAPEGDAETDATRETDAASTPHPGPAP